MPRTRGTPQQRAAHATTRAAPDDAALNGPSAGLVTWYFAVARGGRFVRVTHSMAERVLRRTSVDAVRVPPTWRDEAGGLRLIGVVLVLQDRRPVYIERSVMTAHALPPIRPRTVDGRRGLSRHRRTLGAVAPAPPSPDLLSGGPVRALPVDWQAFAEHLLDILEIGPAVAPPTRRAAFTDFLASSAERVLPSDIARLMQETAHLLATDWLMLLRAGGQSHELWALGAMAVHPARTPLALDADASRWPTTVLRHAISAG